MLPHPLFSEEFSNIDVTLPRHPYDSVQAVTSHSCFGHYISDNANLFDEG